LEAVSPLLADAFRPAVFNRHRELQEIRRLASRGGTLWPSSRCIANKYEPCWKVALSGSIGYSLAVLFGYAHEIVRIDSDCPSDKNKFRNVETAFSGLNLRNKSLTLPDKLSQIHLRKARILPGRNEKHDQTLIKVGMK
jgi:hypothetical protein